MDGMDGFVVPNLASPSDMPPAYGEHRDHVQFSQPGFEAGAAVTDDGRVNININTKNRRLADLLAPTIRRQVSAEPWQRPAYMAPRDGAPSPRLNVVIQIVGSRGDVQPFVALGKVLKSSHGHRVRVATHATFRAFVEDNGLEFFSIGGDPAELMAFMVKHPGLMPGVDALRSGEVSKRRRGVHEMLLGCWRSCIEAGDGSGPPPKPHGRNEPLHRSAGMPGDESQEPFVADAIIANPPSFAHIHVAEKLGIPLHMMFTMPWSSTRAFPHPLANVQSSNADDVMTNYLTYTLVEMMTWQGLGDVINRFREKALDLSPLPFTWGPGLLARLKVPYTYCWSPSLIPKPNDWGDNIEISGFYFLDLASSYTPDRELAAFLDAGPPPVYIGFGSIVVDDPNAMTRMIFDAIQLAGVRALVSKGWGGLGADDVGLPHGVFMLGNVPHDWLFQHVSCVVHHGGAGTTAAGIKAGKPTVVIPFFGDQPFWGAMIARAKAGPRPIRHDDLTAEKLAEAIKFSLEPETRQQARELGLKIRQEHGTDVGVKSFHSRLNMESLRCCVAPGKAAAWRVRRTQFRLSPLAAAVLVYEGLLQYTDVKIYRPSEYSTEEQPTDPVTAGACSLVGDISSIGMALADMPREIFRSSQRSKESQSVQSPLLGSSRRQTLASSDMVSKVGSSTGITSSSWPGPTEAGRDGVGFVLAPSCNSSQQSLPDKLSLARPDTELERCSSTEQLCPEASSRQAISRRNASPLGISMDAAVGAGKGVGRAVSTGVKSPMNFCLGLAKGFRNMPRLYNDDTVRPIDKVTDLNSGIKIAGKELGYGFFDGIAGLVMQPIQGAEKEGAGGFVKGVGKGIGGLIVKPAAGIWGLPAYVMQGVHAQVNKLFTRSVQNHIMASRIVQGERELGQATAEEKADIVRRWNNSKFDLEDFYVMKRKEKTSGKAPTGAGSESIVDSPFSRPKTSWIQIRRLASEERRRLQAQTELLKRGYVNAPVPPPSSSGPSARPSLSEEAEYEQAIRASVRETSRGNDEEDTMVEAAVRQSVIAMRRRTRLAETISELHEKKAGIFEDEEFQITDEEYQELIEQAVQQSLAQHAADASLPRGAGATDDDAVGTGGGGTNDEDAGLQRAIKESKKEPAQQEGDDEEELQRAIAASREEMEREKSQRIEEEIVLKYVKKQSLAEEYSRQMGTGEGKGAAGGGGEEEDDDLKRALEESLRMHTGGDQGGPSASRVLEEGRDAG